MYKKVLYLLIASVFASGCAATSRHTPDFSNRIQATKTIAVMPLEVQMYEVRAGGMAEIIDGWNDQADQLLKDALKESFSDDYGFSLVFIDEDTIKADRPELYRKYKVLYEAVATSALIHSFDITAFPSKKKYFDYTLGSGIQELSDYVNADAIMFMYGANYKETSGRRWVEAANLYLLEFGSDTLTMGLVDGSTGDFLWFKRTKAYEEFDFLDKDNVNEVMEWMSKDFYKE